MSPNSKVNHLVNDMNVPPEVRKRLFGEVLSTQLNIKAETLPRNSKERENCLKMCKWQ